MSDELEFQEEGHIYTLGGRRIISTTQALDILDERPKDPYYLERGKFVHKATELYDKGEFESIDPGDIEQREGYITAYVKFRQDTGFTPTHIEHQLFHPQFFYAGTLDRIGPLNNDPAIIDLKSGAKARVDELQLVAYWELCRVNNISIKKMFDLYLRDNGTYKLEPLKGKPKLLLPVFLAALTCEIWRQKL